MAVETINRIVGYSSNLDISDKLHRLSHRGAVEYIHLDQKDVLRRRMRIFSDHGTECVIAIPRDQSLCDGAVLLLEEERAMVIRMIEERWLCLHPLNIDVATQLGYFAGNLHWRVRFDGCFLLIALEGPEEDYLARLHPFLHSGQVKKIDDD